MRLKIIITDSELDTIPDYAWAITNDAVPRVGEILILEKKYYTVKHVIHDFDSVKSEVKLIDSKSENQRLNKIKI